MSSAFFPVAPTAAPRLRLTARGRRVVAVLALVVLAIVGYGVGSAVGSLPGASASGDAVAADFTYVTVEPGQTLWDIASGVAGDRDVRDVVAEISSLNQLDGGRIEPGQQLALPLWV